jgi:hypothetical protein
MPELLEGLEQLTLERSNSVLRVSRELAGEPEGFLIVTNEICKFIDLVCDIWDVIEMRLRSGGLPAKRLVVICERLISAVEKPADELIQATKVWHKRSLPSGMAQRVYNHVESTQARLNTFLEKVRKARELSAIPPRISADPEKLKQRISQADEEGKWMRLADVVSRIRQGLLAKQE